MRFFGNFTEGEEEGKIGETSCEGIKESKILDDELNHAMQYIAALWQPNIY